MANRKVYWLVIVVAMCDRSAQAQTAGEILRAMRGVGEGIDTLECTGVVKADAGQRVVSHVTYVRKGDKEFYVETPPGGQSTTTWRDGLKVYADQGGKVGTISSGGWQPAFDPWTLFQFRTVERVMAARDGRPGEPPLKSWGAEACTNAGGSSRPGWRLTHSYLPTSSGVQIADIYDIDTGYNSLCVKHERKQTSKSGNSASVVLRAKEVKQVTPGVYLPTQVEMVRGQGKDRAGQVTTVVVYKDFKVNGQVDDGALSRQFPKGCLVKDYTLGVEYEADGAGKPAGKVRPLSKPIKKQL